MREKEGLFDLPESWSWTIASEVCASVRDGTHDTPKYVEKGIPLITSKNLREGELDFSTAKFISLEDHQQISIRSGVEDGDVLFAMIGTVGNPVLVKADKEFSIKNVGLFKKNDFVIDSRYLKFWLSSFTLDKLIEKQSLLKGTTQKFVPLGNLRNLPTPLPPLNEQRRIVAKIEALKARSQRVKEEIEAIPALLDQFRQSVLAAAFRGDLTADWREKNPDVEPASVLLEHTQKAKDNFLEKHQQLSTVQHDDLPELPDSWTWAVTENLSKFESNAICAGPFGTIFKAKDFRDSGIPIIFLRHVGEGKYLTDKPGFMDIDKWEELFKPYSVWGGELLITKLGEPPGSCAIYPEDIGPAMVTPDVIKMSVNTEVALKHYLMYYFNSATSKKIAFGVAYGVTRLRMNLSIFRKLPIPLAPLLEQQEITRQVQILYRIADQVEQQYKEAKSHLDQLNQSILAKAFRGELVPQDPNDEPASVLLERIRAEREKLDTRKKAKGKTEKKNCKAKPEATEPKQLSLPGFE